MFHLPINIDISKVHAYKKFESNGSSYLDNHAQILIKEAYHGELLQSLENLLTSYKIDVIHLDYFLFIIGQHFFLHEAMEEQILNAVECDEPLQFLFSYSMQKAAQDKRLLSKDGMTRKANNSYFELVFPAYKSDKRLRLNNTDFVVKGIYQMFKRQYTQPLKELLLPYESIPPFDIIAQMVLENNALLNYGSRYLIPECALDLLDYLNTNLPGKLSRKQYLFIFDLLYLNGIFLLDESDETVDYKVNENFKVPELLNTEKTEYLTKVIHRYKKYSKTKT